MEMAVEGKAERRFKSPNRILARSFRLGRDNWKAKYKKLKEELKRMKNRVADARRSREQWSSKAQQLQAELGRLKQATAAQDQNQPTVASEEGEKGGR
jgi:chromosome segregation ATPase